MSRRVFPRAANLKIDATELTFNIIEIFALFCSQLALGSVFASTISAWTRVTLNLPTSSILNRRVRYTLQSS